MIKITDLYVKDIISAESLKNIIRSKAGLINKLIIALSIPVVLILTYSIPIILKTAYIRAKNSIILSKDNIRDLEDFINKEKININIATQGNIERLCRPVLGKFAIDSNKLFCAYIKYLVKNSKDHPLKDLPVSEIMVFCESTYAKKAILDLAKESGKEIPGGFSKETICRNLSSTVSIINVEKEKLSQESCLLNKADVRSKLKGVATDYFKEDAEVVTINGLDIDYDIHVLVMEDMENSKNIWYRFDHEDMLAMPSNQVAQYKEIYLKKLNNN